MAPGDNDTLTGGDGNDMLLGDAGQRHHQRWALRGNDVGAPGGAGNDTFIWNPGDGSDTVEGQGGSDSMVFNGANVSENFNISANGQHASGSPATSAMSRWTSTVSSRSTSMLLGACAG